VSIKYSREDNPLGTAGGLGLVKNELRDTFLVMNGDVLTSLDYLEMIGFHRKNNATATVGLNKRSVHIDFGVIEVDRNKNIKEYTEKPMIDYLVSMGVYIFEPEVLEYIKPNEHLNMPDLIKKLVADGKNVKGFIHEGYWLDIGRPEDYQKAQDEFGNNRERFLQ
jgi:NDP-sugar pyrophosphorylase family protein